jgi:hypothetical protein
MTTGNKESSEVLTRNVKTKFYPVKDDMGGVPKDGAPSAPSASVSALPSQLSVASPDSCFARDFKLRGYVLEDCSGKYSPTEWANKAIAAYRRWSADRIVAESNQGGALVENTLRVIDRNVPIRLVHASKGKITRAEPVSALYEQNRVSHVGAFDALEDQLCTFAGGSSDSPDRLDALVWAMTELAVNGRPMVIVSNEMLARASQPSRQQQLQNNWGWSGLNRR